MNKILDVFEVYADTEGKKIDSFKEKINSTMEVKIESNESKQEDLWIEKMENCLEHIEAILKAPTRLIINQEEVVKIEKIKKVTVESIKHLSKNSAFIEEVTDEGDVQPGKLLNVFKEETFNTYENRFVYTLIQRMLSVTRKQKEKCIAEAKAINKEFKEMHYTASSGIGKNKIGIELLMTTAAERTGERAEKAEQLDRIRNLEKNIISLTYSTTYQQLESEHVLQIQPPLKMTNALLKNVHFQYAVKLWDFLINEMDSIKISTQESQVREYKERGKSKKYVDETFLLNYLIMENLDNPTLKNKHKKEILEQLIANMVERTIDINENITEDQLRDLVSKQYTIIKYKKQVTNKEIEEIFKKYISRYVQKINKI